MINLPKADSTLERATELSTPVIQQKKRKLNALTEPLPCRRTPSPTCFVTKGHWRSDANISSMATPNSAENVRASLRSGISEEPEVSRANSALGHPWAKHRGRAYTENCVRLACKPEVLSGKGNHTMPIIRDKEEPSSKATIYLKHETKYLARFEKELRSNCSFNVEVDTCVCSASRSYISIPRALSLQRQENMTDSRLYGRSADKEIQGDTGLTENPTKDVYMSGVNPFCGNGAELLHVCSEGHC
jgi:hypothetical protein